MFRTFLFSETCPNLFQPVPAPPFDAESRDQPGGGREPAEDHGRESADAEVVEAGPGCAAVRVARGVEEVRTYFGFRDVIFSQK